MADLSQFITITPSGESKQYTKGSGVAPPMDTILIQNSSPDTDIVCNIASIGGVIFTPQTFTINKNSNTSIQITYDISQLETLTQGLNTINTVFSFAPVGTTNVNPPTPTPTPTNIQLAINAISGPLSTVAGQTTKFYAAGTGSFAVSFTAYNNINGVANIMSSTLGNLIQWTLNGPGITNAVVGTGATVPITFTTSGIYVVQASLNTTGIATATQADITIVVAPPQVDIFPVPPTTTPPVSVPTSGGGQGGAASSGLAQ